MGNRGGFSWNRALGITKMKRKIARKTGIPWTKSGRQQKIARMTSCGGCLLNAIMVGIFVLLSIALLI
jgi:hypothetical protein